MEVLTGGGAMLQPSSFWISRGGLFAADSSPARCSVARQAAPGGQFEMYVPLAARNRRAAANSHLAYPLAATLPGAGATAGGYGGSSPSGTRSAAAAVSAARRHCRPRPLPQVPPPRPSPAASRPLSPLRSAPSARRTSPPPPAPREVMHGAARALSRCQSSPSSWRGPPAAQAPPMVSSASVPGGRPSVPISLNGSASGSSVNAAGAPPLSPSWAAAAAQSMRPMSANAAVRSSSAGALLSSAPVQRPQSAPRKRTKLEAVYTTPMELPPSPCWSGRHTTALEAEAARRQPRSDWLQRVEAYFSTSLPQPPSPQPAELPRCAPERPRSAARQRPQSAKGGRSGGSPQTRPRSATACTAANLGNASSRAVAAALEMGAVAASSRSAGAGIAGAAGDSARLHSADGQRHSTVSSAEASAAAAAVVDTLAAEVPVAEEGGSVEADVVDCEPDCGGVAVAAAAADPSEGAPDAGPALVASQDVSAPEEAEKNGDGMDSVTRRCSNASAQSRSSKEDATSSASTKRRSTHEVAHTPAEVQQGLSQAFDESMLEQQKHLMENYREDFQGFSDAQTERHRAAFMRGLRMGESEIHADELKGALEHLGYLKVTEEVVKLHLDGLTGYSMLDFDEFLQFASKHVQHEYREMRRTFHEMDTDGSGSLDVQELEGVFWSLGITPFSTVIGELLLIVDEDGSGELEFEEFVRLILLYRMTGGFTSGELQNLSHSFAQFGSPGGGLKAQHLEKSLLHNFGPQAADLARKVIKQHTPVEEIPRGEPPDMNFQEYLVWARRLREAEVAEYRRLFVMYDSDGSGQIERDEMKQMLHMLGYTPMTKVLNELVSEIDMDGNCELDFEEFVQLMEVFRARAGFTEDEIAYMRRAFNRFANEGVLTCMTLVELMRYDGHPIKLYEVQDLMGQVDFDGTGMIDFNAFKRLMRIHRESQLRSARAVYDGGKQPSTGLVAIDDVNGMLEALDICPDETISRSNRDHVGFVDFDRFVEIADESRKWTSKRRRFQAGFSDEEVCYFMEVLERYTDEVGLVQRQQLTKLLKDLCIPMRTIEDQGAFLDLLEEAQSAAAHAGVPEDQLGAKSRSAPALSFWVFVHLARRLRARDEVTQIDSETCAARETRFNQDEISQFRGIFLRCAKKGEEHGAPLSPLFGAPPPMRGASEFIKKEPPLLVSFESMRRLLLTMGVQLRPAQREGLANEVENLTGRSYQTALLDFPVFLRLMRWLVDNGAIVPDQGKAAS
eukprot:TRINITY_DN27170_c0_g1_i1.p1 TRINITY_DN27170_c0_g1~~TRINITY_DN27170_c0_g1_i1.p1  ORF type:complete len:1244 (-),score=273.77 TRINITY_DN27170_c0_g1_i1:203-3934(-)